MLWSATGHVLSSALDRSLVPSTGNASWRRDEPLRAHVVIHTLWLVRKSKDTPREKCPSGRDGRASPCDLRRTRAFGERESDLNVRCVCQSKEANLNTRRVSIGGGLARETRVPFERPFLSRACMRAGRPRIGTRRTKCAPEVYVSSAYVSFLSREPHTRSFSHKTNGTLCSRREKTQETL